MSTTNSNPPETAPAEEPGQREPDSFIAAASKRVTGYGWNLWRFAPRPKRRWLALLAFAAIGVLAWPALVIRARSHTPPAAAVGPELPTVAAARVVREDLYNELTIPAEFRPFAEVELHAKVSGYVQDIGVDIGDRVKTGQLLATLEVPELKDELNRTVAAQKRADADYHDAHLAYTRLRAVNQQHPGLVAQQDLDTAEARNATTEATLAAAKAEVEKNETLLAYTRITAPFGGVVTYRYADPGTLIQSGTASDTQSLPLVRLADMYLLRLDFPVSVAYVSDIQQGDSAEVRVDSLGGRSFTGTISRFSHSVSEATRTMTTEIEVPNPKLELMPGMYAKVVLRVEKRPKTLSIPIQAVATGERPTVYAITPDGKIEERPVSLGLETPTRYEVTNGLKEGELVLIGARGELRPGEKVEPKVVGDLALK